MKKITIWLAMGFCLLALAGCSGEEMGNREANTSGETGTLEGNAASEGMETPEEIVPTGEYVPAAEFTNIPVELARGKFFYRENEIIYLSQDADEVLALPGDGTGIPRVVVKIDQLYGILDFFLDGEGSLYLFECEIHDPNFQHDYYLRKIDEDGQEIYRESIEEGAGLSYIYADGEGNMVLYSNVTWDMCFYDSEGRYQGKDTVSDETAVYDKYGWQTHMPRIQFAVNDLICIGGQYFLWRVNEGEASISLWEVDFVNCRISEERVVDMSALGDGKYREAQDSLTYVLHDGGELGLLVSTEDILWQYDIETGASAELLHWDDRLVNIDGRYVRQLNVGGEVEGGIAFDVVAYSASSGTYAYGIPEVAKISYVDKAYIKESRVVSIGLSNISGSIEQTIRRFNRLNNGYEVVIVDRYDPAMLKDMLSYGEEIPDLLDITDIRTGWLENKGLVENLVPYFERSKTISKEDILPGVWGLLEGEDGKVTSMATGFKIRALTTAADLPEDGWTYGQLLSLEGQYPGSLYMRQHTPTWLWSLISMTGVDEFIDWEKRKCSFNSEEFRNLIEGVKNLDYPVNQKLENVADTLELVMSGRVLMQFSNYGSPHDYEKEQEESGGGLKAISFPTMDGEPTYIFAASQSLAIYGESPNKDGAWAFLEFLLTDGEQNWYGADRDVFPVNAKAFEGYLDRTYSFQGFREIASDETKEKIRYMVSHLALNQNAADEISSIINEELKAYFAGDKTVKQTAKTIQNRVQLYLDEM